MRAERAPRERTRAWRPHQPKVSSFQPISICIWMAGNQRRDSAIPYRVGIYYEPAAASHALACWRCGGLRGAGVRAALRSTDRSRLLGRAPAPPIRRNPLTPAARAPGERQRWTGRAPLAGRGDALPVPAGAQGRARPPTTRTRDRMRRRRCRYLRRRARRYVRLAHRRRRRGAEVGRAHQRRVGRGGE